MVSKENSEKSPGRLQVIQSVIAAAFGVQSTKNRERDFAQGKPWHYIAGGVVFTVLFILGVWTLVQYMLSAARV